MPADGAAWGADFADTYWIASRRNQERRQRRRARRREPSPEAVAARAARLAAAQARIDVRFAAAQHAPGFTSTYWQFVCFHAGSGDPDARLVQRAECEPIFAELRRERQAAQRAMVRHRLNEGYHSPGGPVGGNPAYWRAPFVYRGLVSDEHPLLQLFVASVPRAARLWTGKTKSVVQRIDQKLLACDDPYVDTSSSMRRVLRVELDRIFAGGIDELKAAIAACGVPLPNLVVGYIDPAGRLLHPHLIWLLDQSVAFTGKSLQAPQKLWAAVLRGLTAALLPIGADPGGLANARRVKNPLSPEWDCTVLAPAPYSLAPDTREGAPGLAALAPHLDLEGAWALLRGETAARQGKPPATDHPDPVIAAQSNALFRHLSVLARANVARYRGQENGTAAGFRQELLAEALRISPGSPAADRCVVATADSVARWTWDHYRQPPAQTPCATPEERHARQAAGQTKGAVTRRAATLVALIAAAIDLSRSGQRLTQSAVGAAAGRSGGTVRQHWPAVLEAVRNQK